jgi:hypothetical protein
VWTNGEETIGRQEYATVIFGLPAALVGTSLDARVVFL